MRLPSVLAFATVLFVGSSAEASEPLKLRSAWLEDVAPAAGFGELFQDAQEALEDAGAPGFEARKRQKKSARAKKTTKKKSGNTLTYGALAGHVAPMNKNIGLGLQIGAPTGVTAKFLPVENVGIVGGLGAGVGWLYGLSLSVYVDLIWHPHVLVKADFFRLSWYFGGGLWFGFAPFEIWAPPGAPVFYAGWHYMRFFGYGFYSFGSSFAVRVPMGLSIALNELPIEIYAEATPSFLFFPAIGAGLGATIGLRFYL